MADDKQQVIAFDYHQSLTVAAGGKSWSETIEVSVKLFSEVFSSGWYKNAFGKDSTSFVILLNIAMHGRPLRGEDLELMIRLGMATVEDEGRLYARITDIGLADELGLHRTTVAERAAKLAELGVITILQVPEGLDFRDSRGSFAGSKVYLISGELGDKISKSLADRASESAKAVPSDTKPSVSDHRVGNTDTVPTSTNIGAKKHRVGNTDTVNDSKSAKNDSGASSKYVSGDTKLGVSKHRVGSGDIHVGKTDTNLNTNIEEEEGEKHPPAPQAKILIIDTRLAPAVDICKVAGLDITEPVLARLSLMIKEADAAATKAGSSGEQWVADALQLGVGNCAAPRLLNYGSTVLGRWITNGRPERKAQLQQSGKGEPRKNGKSGGNGKTTTQTAIERYLEKRHSDVEAQS